MNFSSSNQPNNSPQIAKIRLKVQPTNVNKKNAGEKLRFGLDALSLITFASSLPNSVVFERTPAFFQF
jgi:arginine decarboxylase-like protein